MLRKFAVSRLHLAASSGAADVEEATQTWREELDAGTQTDPPSTSGASTQTGLDATSWIWTEPPSTADQGTQTEGPQQFSILDWVYDEVVRSISQGRPMSKGRLLDDIRAKTTEAVQFWVQCGVMRSTGQEGGRLSGSIAIVEVTNLEGIKLSVRADDHWYSDPLDGGCRSGGGVANQRADPQGEDRAVGDPACHRHRQAARGAHEAGDCNRQTARGSREAGWDGGRAAGRLAVNGPSWSDAGHAVRGGVHQSCH